MLMHCSVNIVTASRPISASPSVVAKPGKFDNERIPSSLSHTFPNAYFNG